MSGASRHGFVKTDRMLRVDELLKQELGLLMERDIAPAQSALVTLTRVKTSPDLQQAEVYVSVMGSEAQKQTVLQLLHDYRREFQSVIARHIKIKYTPILRFHLDNTIEKGGNVLALIEQLHLADAAPAPAGAGDDEADPPAGK